MHSVALDLHCTSITQMFFDENPFALRVAGARLGQKGLSMKKTYQKPVLTKREKLSSVVAVQGSGPF